MHCLGTAVATSRDNDLEVENISACAIELYLFKPKQNNIVTQCEAFNFDRSVHCIDKSIALQHNVSMQFNNHGSNFSINMVLMDGEHGIVW